jgi:hypothetical protein
MPRGPCSCCGGPHPRCEGRRDAGVHAHDRFNNDPPYANQASFEIEPTADSIALIGSATRAGRVLISAVRLPEGDLPVIAGDGTSKSAASRRFVALSAERLAFNL